MIMCRRYGFVLVGLSVPFLCAAALVLGAIVFAMPGRSEFGTIQALAVSGFLFWTFLVPLVAGIRLMRAGRSGAAGNSHFLHAYRLMRLGSIFSLMPFFAVVGGLGSIWLAAISIAGRGYGNTADYVMGAGFALSALAIVFYVLFFSLRRMKRQMFPTSASD